MMKTKRFYIVERMYQGDPQWAAHASGLFSMFGFFPDIERIARTLSFQSADQCEQKLRKIVAAKAIKPKVIRIIEI